MEDAKAMSEHTPGPWDVGKTLLPPHRIDGVWSRDGMHICSFAHCISIEPEYEVLRANARLIAAAPLMLAALEAVEPILRKNLYPCPDKPNSDWAKYKQLAAALKAAKGE